MALLFKNGGNETDGGSLELDGASAVTSADVGGKTFVFVAGADDNGVSVFELGRDGSLTNRDNVTDSGSLNLTGVSGLTTITSGGSTYLVAAGPTDNGLSVFRVSTAGVLTAVHDLADDATLKLAGVSRLASATVGGTPYVFAAGTVDDGISVFRVAANGMLTSVFNLADAGALELDGVKGLTTAVVGASTYLFAAGGVDNGFSVLRIGADGSLTEVNSVTDAGAMNLAGASDVATAVVGGVTYLFVAGAADNGVSVFSVNSSGILTNVANVSNTANLRLAGAESLTVSTFGSGTYLTVGGSESGVSMFKVNSGGALTFVENIDDAGARELSGVTHVHTATAGGTSWVIATGATDDGVSTFGLKPSGQLWYATEGADGDARITRVNSDGWGHSVLFDNGTSGTGDDKLSSNFVADVGVDTAAGVYFVFTNAGSTGLDGKLSYGLIGSSAAPTVAFSLGSGVVSNGMQVDAINHKVYVGYQDNNGVTDTGTGIRVYSYSTTTGALTDQGFLITAASDDRAKESGAHVLDPRDFALDPTAGSGGYLFYTELLSTAVKSVGLFRLDLGNLGHTTQVVAQTQFPDSGANGFIYDVEVDQTTDLVYFTTQSFSPYDTAQPGSANYNAAQNAIWYIAENASAGTATKVTLSGAVGTYFYPGDMTFDQNTRQLYVESKEIGNGSADDVIYVFQLDTAGTSASLINTIYPTTFTASSANIQGMVFSHLPVLSVSGTSAAAAEQGAAVTLLTGAPTLTDTDGGYLVGAKVQITGGKFASNEASADGDHLGYGASKVISGLAGATNITLSWDAASETLSLSGYDTLANYKAVLAQIVFWSTGDNPTNYGLNTTRTLTWSVDDGTPDVPAGGGNSGTTTLTISAANDAPVNTVSTSSGSEGASIAVTGLQVSDPDASPILQSFSVTLSVPSGAITVLTNVTGGLTSGQVTGNGSGTVSLTGTLSAINATLAATNGVLFAAGANVHGDFALTMTSSDGAASDTDVHTITVLDVNSAPVVSGDGTASLTATNEDITPSGLSYTVLSLFGGQFDDSADLAPGAAATSTFAGVAVVANGSSSATGQWQYWNGSTWADIGATSAAAAVGLKATAPLRFAPAADFNGAAPTLTVRLIDTSYGALGNGATINTSTNGGATAISTGTVVLSHEVTDVNDAPAIINGSVVSLTAVAEDAGPSTGQTIGALFGGHFSDAQDGGASVLTGVAVTANAATTEGVYQYLDGATWWDMPAVSTTNAFVLDASTQVRFVPAANYNGVAPALTVSMIEDAGGTAITGQTTDLTHVGGSTPYSAFMTLSIDVTPTNDAPTFTGSATLAAVAEDAANPTGATVASLFGGLFHDIDGDSLAGVAVVANPATAAQGAWQYFNGTAWVDLGAYSEASALVLAAGTSLRFAPAANFNGAAPALSAHLIDNSGGAVTAGALVSVAAHGGQTRFSDTAVTLSTNVTAVNDAPVVPATATAVNATEQTPAILLGGLSVSDVELDARNSGAGDYAGAAFTVQRATANASDLFAFDTAGAGFTVSGGAIQVGGHTIATYTATGGVLTISFTSSGATASTALVNDVLKHITYAHGSDAPPASVSLTYALSDGGGQGTGGTLSASGAVTVNITAVNDPHGGGVTITGTTTEDQVLTAVSTLTDPDGMGTLHYQWQRGTGSTFTDIGGATGTSYTLGDADVGQTVRVKVSFTDAGGALESETSPATATIANINDAPTGAVTADGTATEDQTLTANTSALADADGLGTLNYQWQRGTGSTFTNISGATASTYTLGDPDVGKTVRVVVSYTDQHGAAETVTGAATATVTGVNDPHTGAVTISGTATEDQVLTAVTSTLADPDGLGTLSYAWQRNTGSGFNPISGATSATYTLGDADVGHTVRVVVSYTDLQGFPETETSAATGAIANVNDAPTGAVTLTGTATEDQTLTAVTSTLADADGLGTLSYKWQRGTGSTFTDISGATASTYTLGDADVGKTVRVVVSYTDQHGAAETVTGAPSATIAGVNDPHTGAVTISGTTTEDQVLTAVTSTLADVDGLGTLHYAWQRGTGSTFTAISGATAATYTLGDADVGQTVRVVVSYTDLQGFSETETSAATATIANVNDAPTGAVTATGTATEDQVLTANTSALADADGLGTLSYQWQRGTGSTFTDIGGATASTYTLGDPDVGKTVRVVVSYTDLHGTSETVTGTPTGVATGVNDPHTGGVTISGTTTEDQVLTAVTSTLADVDGLGTLSYKWQRGTGSTFADIGGATASTYTLGDADVGQTVRAVVSYTDLQGFAETATSPATAAIVNINDAPTGTVVISGSAVESQTLTASNTLADNDGLGTITYQWKANGATIGTGATLALTSAYVGQAITVTASYTDLHGAAESVASSSVTVAAAPVVVTPPTTNPPTTTPPVVIDGASVEVTKTTNVDGSITQTTTIAPVTPAASGQAADIPLFTESGQSLLSVSAPVGFSMTITGNDHPETAAGATDDLMRAIRGVGGDSGQTSAASSFLTSLAVESRVLVQSVTPTVAASADPSMPLTFEGSPAGNGVFTALVLDVTKLPSGTIINLNNIDFVTIVGAARLGGGDGAQVVFGDDAEQYIVLGADDDILHGGGGNDVIGSKGGNDMLYGDAGDDTLFGGEGNDYMDGGTGYDTVLMGGNLKDYVFIHTAKGLQSLSFEGEDTMVNVEALKMVDGTVITDLNKLVNGTTSVAVMTYQFFTGKTPTAAGLEYLLHAPDSVNASDLSDPYYLKFNVDNRYINFAINLASPQGQAHAWFAQAYGSLTFEQTLSKAYKEIFGVTLTADKVQHLLYDPVGQDMTRLHYFELFAGSADGAKAGIIGWLLAAAVLENTGRYAAANTAFLSDFADGDAKLNVDLVAVYGDGHAWGTLT